MGVAEITQIKKGIIITYEQHESAHFRNLTDVLDKGHHKYMVKMTDTLKIRVDTNEKGENMLTFLTKILEKALAAK